MGKTFDNQEPGNSKKGHRDQKSLREQVQGVLPGSTNETEQQRPGYVGDKGTWKHEQNRRDRGQVGSDVKKQKDRDTRGGEGVDPPQRSEQQAVSSLELLKRYEENEKKLDAIRLMYESCQLALDALNIYYEQIETKDIGKGISTIKLNAEKKLGLLAPLMTSHGPIKDILSLIEIKNRVRDISFDIKRIVFMLETRKIELPENIHSAVLKVLTYLEEGIIIDERKIYSLGEEQMSFIGARVLRPNTPQPPQQEEKVPYNNPPIKKLHNAFFIQEDTADAFLSWHREYILGGGLDTFRKKNTDTQLSDKKIETIKDSLEALAENIIELLERKKKGENVHTTLQSRIGDYEVFAKILSGYIPPDSPEDYILRSWEVDEFLKTQTKIRNERKAPTINTAPVVSPVATVSSDPIPQTPPAPEPAPQTSVDPNIIQTQDPAVVATTPSTPEIPTLTSFEEVIENYPDLIEAILALPDDTDITADLLKAHNVPESLLDTIISLVPKQ